MSNWRDILQCSSSIPRDDEDSSYVQSFALNTSETPLHDSIFKSNNKEAISFFESYGFVVFREIFTSQECEVSIDSFWDIAESLNTGFNHLDEKSWKNLKSGYIIQSLLLSGYE